MVARRDRAKAGLDPPHLHQKNRESTADFLARLARARRTRPDTVGHVHSVDDLPQTLNQAKLREAIARRLADLAAADDVSISQLDLDLEDLSDDDDFEIDELDDEGDSP